MDRVHVIACAVLAMDIGRAAERLGLKVTTQFLEGGLHSRPADLRRQLQQAIDSASAHANCDRIAVGYGLCGRGTLGIHARNLPLAIPKAQDCIALFLGSDRAYRKEFSRFPGTYYISAGWFEEKVQPKGERGEGKGERREASTEGELRRLREKYGEENARAIIAFMGSWKKNYQRAVFIDTGSGSPEKYASYAEAMAEEFGWRYEVLPGDLSLLEKTLTAVCSTPEVLLVPPHHVTAYVAVTGTLQAVPVWKDVSAGAARPRELAKDPPAEPRDLGKRTRLGLGIDAGGTYTDAVIYDFAAHAVLDTGKALTTKWDYTVGIENALDTLDPEKLKEVDLVAVSTTLATNAIVEGLGQTVGLLVMPPYGLFESEDIPHHPTAPIAGSLDIDGSEITPIDPEQVRRVGRELVERHRVGAFAVSGYAGVVNPAHELQVKTILTEQTGLHVTCGHQLSELLNFRTRADTAVLNARIIPRLKKFLREAELSLRNRGINAPVLVVKGNGSLMSAATAQQRPIETILSGPAASVAGARHLCRCTDAIVMDMGGTTSDTACVRNGLVRTCPSGARVGRWQTHVQALDMRTIGLGGDSLIALEKTALRVGPRRVGPVAWLASEYPHTGKALDYIERHLDQYSGSTRAMAIFALSGHTDGFEPDEDEKRIVNALRERPFAAAELADRVGARHHRLLRMRRLEEHYVVQRCGLTPTDLLHTLRRFQRWDAAAACRMRDMASHVCGLAPDAFAQRVIDLIIRQLALELLKKQLDSEIDPDVMDDCPACQALMANMADRGSDELHVSITLKSPVIGLGAPAACFLPQAGKLLNTRVLIPPYADVANAVGAITSSVVVSRQAHVRPNESGEYVVEGLSGSPSFRSFEDAHRHGVEALKEIVLDLARDAGTSETNVEVQVDDRIARTADGAEVFLERVLNARLSGPPDIACLRDRPNASAWTDVEQ